MDNQKEVKAAKDKLELEQLKKDTEQSLMNVKKFEEVKRKADALVESHTKKDKEEREDPNAVEIRDAEKEK